MATSGTTVLSIPHSNLWKVLFQDTILEDIPLGPVLRIGLLLCIVTSNTVPKGLKAFVVQTFLNLTLLFK